MRVVNEDYKDFIVWGGISAVVLLFLLVLVGFPADAWTPIRAVDFLRGFLLAGMLFAVGVCVFGLADAELAHDIRVQEPYTVYTSSGATGLIGLCFLFASVVLTIRYVYLIICQLLGC